MYLPILVTHLLFLKNTPVLKYSVYTSFKYLTPYGGSSTLPWMSLVSPVKNRPLCTRRGRYGARRVFRIDGNKHRLMITMTLKQQIFILNGDVLIISVI